MRYQERIYIQTPSACIRNKDSVNVNMSSDLCEFNKHMFSVVGADKIKTGTTINDDEIHIINTGSTIDLTFSFSGDLQNFVDIGTTFNYDIYKYNPNANSFSSPPIFTSNNLEFEGFISSSGFTDSVLVSDLVIDGQYLIKGNYEFSTCTNILGQLGDTTKVRYFGGDQYGLYDGVYDYYFAAIKEATKPNFTLSQTDTTTLGALRVESYIVSGGTQVILTNFWLGNPIVSLNGITLFEDIKGDFTTENNNTINFISELIEDDIVTVGYVNDGNPNGLISEASVAANPIISGVTDGEGSETIYYNTDTNKYELFMATIPVVFNDIIITLNGITLGNGIDYVPSSSNPKRVILNGILFPYDVITITYNTSATFVGTINVNIFDVVWTVSPPPSNDYGLFTIYVAEDEAFNDLVFSASTQYITNSSTYQANVDLSSYSGTTAFYKVINEKFFDVLSGDTITTINESEVIPIEIQL
tara:strand:- start:717 stop:2135 length:1419 start_codon:yes stop_codon:yes gene_type:complete